MKAFTVFAMALVLTACSTPKPEFQDPSFASSTATTVFLLPLADQRTANQRVETPQAMQHFADVVTATVLFSNDNYVGMLLHNHGFTLLDPKNLEAKTAIQPADLLYFQLALTDYDSTPPINYSTSCSAEIRAGNKNGNVLWRNTSTASVTFAGLLVTPDPRGQAFSNCIDNMLRALPDKRKD